MARRDKPLPEEVHASWLGELLAGQTPTLSRLQEMMKVLGESVHLEYKGASDEDDQDHPGEKEKLRSILKKYIAGFANGAGGVLVYGVSERRAEQKKGQTRRVIGYELDPMRTLSREDADRVVNEERARLHPYLPRDACRRFFVEGLPEGQEVLVLAVERVERLVPVVEGGKSIHYLRIGDSTVPAPAYLSDDLLMGRRRRPDLYVGAYFLADEHRDGSCRGEITIHIENVGLTWAEDPRVGIVTLDRVDPGKGMRARLPLEMLRAIVELQHPQSPDDEYELRRVAWGPRGAVKEDTLGTFEVAFLSMGLEVPVVGDRMIWAAAAYITCRNDEPRWGQLLVRFDQDDLKLIIPDEPPDGRRLPTLLLPCSDGRARVGLHVLKEGEWHPSVEYLTSAQGADGEAVTSLLRKS